MANNKNRGTGAGGAQTNFNGISFEERDYLEDFIAKVNKYEMVSFKVHTKRSSAYKVFDDQKRLVAYYGRQASMYDALKDFLGESFNNFYIDQIFSARINPDAFILNVYEKTLHIFEKKWQQTTGSVDEKIQTAPFKLAMFEKLLKQFGIKITYNYILSDYFANLKFRNVKDYYKEQFAGKIQIYVEGENLDQLDILKYLT